MATKKSKSSKPAAKKKSTKKLSVRSLVAVPTNLSQAADVNFLFKSGVGQATASLFRKGVLIDMQSISSSGTIHLSEVQSNDVISINGVCAGTADIKITVNTTPTTPDHFDAGIILAGYLVN
jgi:hypothetical protein